MDRRELLKLVAVLTGGTVIGGKTFLTGCRNKDAAVAGFPLNDTAIALLNEIGETIIPATDTPGAKEANVGAFMNTMVMDCYEVKEQEIFLEGITELNEACTKMHGHDFMKASSQQREELLTAIDKETSDYRKNKKPEDPAHYFSMMKQLTLLGYFTSEAGATKALRYVAVPGKYEGCIPYQPGDKAWAT